MKDLVRDAASDGWRSTGPDPTFLARRWALPGWYILSFEASSQKADPNGPMIVWPGPSLYPIVEAAAPMRHVLPVKLPLARIFHFLPMTCPGTFTLRDVKLERVQSTVDRTNAQIRRGELVEPLLLPYHDIAPVAPGRWRSVGPDAAHIILVSLEPGLYELTLHGRSVTPNSLCDTQVYFGHPDAAGLETFSEADSERFEPLPLCDRSEPHRYSLEVPVACSSLRLDVLDDVGEYVLERVTIRRAKADEPRATTANSHPEWLERRIAARRGRYPAKPRPKLFSILTCAYDTAPDLLRAMGESVLAQTWRDFEWILLDNGSTNPATRAVLAEFAARDPRTRLLRVDPNRGIMGGMRHCLEHATGRYVVPFDSDDIATPDALEILAHFAEREGDPALLYSDEDMAFRGRNRDPMFKHEFDPVLLATHCYIAHLDAIDREKALEYGCYADEGSRGSHDWDSFLRFVRHGHVPRHVPEILYSWVMSESSCALNMGSKSYIVDSQRHVVDLHLASLPEHERFTVDRNPLAPEGALHWRLRRKKEAPRELSALVLRSDAPAEKVERLVAGLRARYPLASVELVDEGVVGLRRALERASPLVLLVSDRVDLPKGAAYEDAIWDAVGQLELFPDTVCVGGPIMHEDRLLEGGKRLGFDGLAGTPEEGASRTVSRKLHHLVKTRSTGAVSLALAVAARDFVRETLDAYAREPLALSLLGEWLGAHAERAGRRVIYSPFLRADLRALPLWRPAPEDAASREAFRRVHGALLERIRFYSPLLGRTRATAFQPVPPEQSVPVR